MGKFIGIFAALLTAVSVGHAQEPAPALITILASADVATSPDVTAPAGRTSAKQRHGAPDKMRSVVLDGVLDARLGTDRFFSVTVLSGEHDLRSENAASFSFPMEPGEHAYIRLAMAADGGSSDPNKETFVKLSCSEVAAYLAESHPKPASEFDVYAGMVVVEKSFPKDCASLLNR